jgi:hypothetical protein
MISLKQLEELKAAGKIRGWTESFIKGAYGLADKKPSKYGNVKTVVDGIEFDSAKEAGRYMVLKYRQGMGEIRNLCTQVEFKLEVNGEKIASYICDFMYEENGKMIVEDVKSKVTRKIAQYRLKKKLMKSIYNIEIKEV